MNSTAEHKSFSSLAFFLYPVILLQITQNYYYNANWYIIFDWILVKCLYTAYIWSDFHIHICPYHASAASSLAMKTTTSGLFVFSRSLLYFVSHYFSIFNFFIHWKQNAMCMKTNNKKMFAWVTFEFWWPRVRHKQQKPQKSGEKKAATTITWKQWLCTVTKWTGRQTQNYITCLCIS